MHFQLAAHSAHRLIGLYHTSSGNLSAVHRRTAAKSNDALAAVFDIHVLTLLNAGDRRIRAHAVKYHIGNADLVQFRKQRIQQMQCDQTLVGYHQHLFYALALNQLRQAQYGTGTLQQLGCGPVHKTHGYLKNALINSVPALFKCPKHKLYLLYKKFQFHCTEFAAVLQAILQKFPFIFNFNMLRYA